MRWPSDDIDNGRVIELIEISGNASSPAVLGTVGLDVLEDVEEGPACPFPPVFIGTAAVTLQLRKKFVGLFPGIDEVREIARLAKKGEVSCGEFFLVDPVRRTNLEYQAGVDALYYSELRRKGDRLHNLSGQPLTMPSRIALRCTWPTAGGLASTS
jgi:hypothetical protein